MTIATDHRPAHQARRLQHLLAYLRLEVSRLLRNAGFLGPTVAVPTIMYLVFTRFGDNASDPRVGPYLMVSMACFGAVGAALFSGLSAIEERDTGWLRQLSVTPISPVITVIGRGLVGVLVAIPSVVVVCLAGALINGVRLSPLHWALMVAALVVGIIPIALLGVAIGYSCSASLAQPMSLLLNFGMALLGGLWIPANNFPALLQQISAWVPTAGYGEFGRSTAGIVAFDALPVLRLIGWSLVFLLLAVVASRRGRVRTA